MENKNLQNSEEKKEKFETEILRNDDVHPGESTVVIEEENRTVMLTEDETLIIEKEPKMSIAPKNRPRKVYAGMWGTPEIVTVALALLSVLTLVLIFVFFVLPMQQELDDNRAKRDALEQEYNSAFAKYGDITSTETQVAKLITSVNDFESRFLKTEAVGTTSIYQRINGLIGAYSLTNTTGPDYAPLEISEDERRRGTDSEEQRGRSKFQSLFPGVYVTMTVEGSYQNLRQFMREIESSQEFMIISSIELEPSETNDSDGKDNTITVTQTNEFDETIKVEKKAPPRGKTRGTVVALRLEVAAYFQRPADQRAITSLPDAGNLDEPIIVKP